MATVRELLSRKGSNVLTVSSAATVLDATREMNEHRVGAVVVTRGGKIAGIFTERDVLRRVVAEQRSPGSVRVEEVMTVDVLCCAPDTPIEQASRIMKDCRIRHLPICDDHGHLAGLISIGDLNAYHASDQEATIRFLNEYLYGGAELTTA